MRLIDADKIRYAKDWVVTDRIPMVGGYNAKAVYRVTKDEIDAMPTVDTAPVRHGRWTMVQGELAFWDKCSECGKKILHRTPYYDFCPNCGALMEVEHGRPD